MKAKMVKNESKFNPIKIELLIETKDELFELWHRLNLDFSDIKRISNDIDVPFPAEDGDTDLLWQILNLRV